jgi:hypothetical protein
MEDRAMRDRFKTKSELHEHVRQVLTLERLCMRFPRVVRQLQQRHGNRPPFTVQDEYDVCDLLRALLASEHDLVEAVEWIPPYVDEKPRSDLFLRFEKIVVEGRMSGETFGEKELREQLAVDIRHYETLPACEMLVCFVYDPHGFFNPPGPIEDALRKDDRQFSVRVIVAPKLP